MRKNLILIAMAALACAGCKTTPTDDSLASTIAMIDAVVPIEVAAVVADNPSLANDLNLAADRLDALAAATNMLAPALVVAELNKIEMSKEARLAVVQGLILWQLYASQHPTALPADARAILATIAKDIRLGMLKAYRP